MPRMMTFRYVPTEPKRFSPAPAPAPKSAPGLVTTLLAGLLAMAGCAQDPSADYLGGFGDPLRGAALYAPQNLGDTSRWAGRPAEAAVAAEQLEFLTDGLPASPIYATELNPAVVQGLTTARVEMRHYLGIAPDADPQVVIASLRRAAAALRANGQAGGPTNGRALAEAALDGPAFTAGPVGTLQRLAAMPRLPRTAEAAGLVASDFDRLERRR
ncbi:MAG: hypothetical protein JWP04_1238 [Belnapia sp.]|nr:hypothetical protein [Belnapia sp.]